MEADGLCRRYGELVALSGFDLRIGRGEVFGLVGADGAGKTTALQMLAAILDPSEGRARVLGHDTVRETDRVTGHLGYMSQAFSLYGRLTVEENVDFFARLHRVAHPAAAERKKRLLEFARLAPHRRRLADKLSGGMQKKLALCCALIHEPELLILDEPTTGVDPVSRREFWDILHEALAGGTTLVVSTPYMDEAERCNRVALLNEGRQIACDTPQRLRALLSGRMLEVETTPRRAALALLRQAFPGASPYVLADRIRLFLPEGGAASVEAVLGQGGVTVRQCRPAAVNLEDVVVARLAPDPEPAATLPTTGPRQASSRGSAIEVSELTRRFGNFTAVDRVSFTIERGRIFGLLGPNGSGKTTLIRMLCGLTASSGGRARVAGMDLQASPRHLRARIGYVAQRFSLYDDLTVGENLDFFGGVYRVPGSELSARRAWALALAGLRDQERRLTRDLSGGYKQRLALACAVLHEPEVLFLDEPTSGVDPVSRRRFWDLIDGLVEHGVTVLVTTHYMDEAEHCHTLGMLHDGRLIGLGSPDALREELGAQQMLELECDQPVPALGLLKAAAWQASLFGDRLHILVNKSEGAGTAIQGRLEAAGHHVQRLEPVPLGIEDVFLALVRRAQEHSGAAQIGE